MTLTGRVAMITGGSRRIGRAITLALAREGAIVAIVSRDRERAEATIREGLTSRRKLVLSLTKLNWASTDSLCAEPITTKYAGDIAYLTAAFLRQGGVFRLHPVLERTPWFI